MKIAPLPLALRSGARAFYTAIGAGMAGWAL